MSVYWSKFKAFKQSPRDTWSHLAELWATNKPILHKLSTLDHDLQKQHHSKLLGAGAPAPAPTPICEPPFQFTFENTDNANSSMSHCMKPILANSVYLYFYSCATKPNCFTACFNVLRAVFILCLACAQNLVVFYLFKLVSSNHYYLHNIFYNNN